MLVLTRRKFEQIIITVGGEKIVVRVVDIGRERVRLGITAPKSVTIHREEVSERIEAEQAEIAAAGSTGCATS